MPESGKKPHYEFFWTVRVYYEDTDSGGVVYYANYLRFMERARTECLRQWGFEQDSLRDDQGIIFAVSEISVSYHRPAKFNDELEIKTNVIKLGRASILFEQDICRSADGEQLCTARVKIACLNAERFSVQAIPENIYQTIKNRLA